jgi:hypothetical protein
MMFSDSMPSSLSVKLQFLLTSETIRKCPQEKSDILGYNLYLEIRKLKLQGYGEMYAFLD